MSALLPFRDKRLPAVPATASIHHNDPLLHIERQAKYIQRNLQALIDAQSEGLLSGPSHADGISERSSTPSSSRVSRTQSPSQVSPRKPLPKKTGLRAARQGIFNSIFDLLKLREEEREILLSRTDERDNALHELQGFVSRKSGLQEAISTIHNDNETQRGKRLQEEAHGLEADIHELETRLYEMKAKHRQLVNEISNIENSVDAKLSSYNESMSLLESDIQTYLRNPPVQPLSVRVNESTLFSLNPKRRTIEIAQDHWGTEQEQLRKRQHEVNAEILALEEGGGVWKQAMADVSGFEKRLTANMRHYIELQAQATMPESAQPEDTPRAVAEGVAEDLDKTTKRLEAHLELAEEKDWKLLVCCIGAELEALREARKMLLPAFGLTVPNDAPATSPPPSNAAPADESTEAHVDEHEDPLGNDNLDPPADLLKDGGGEQRDGASRSEDDEPDPSWL